MDEMQLFLYLSRKKYEYINQCIQTFQQRYRYRNVRMDYKSLMIASNKRKMIDRISGFIYMKIMKIRYQKIIARVKIIQATYRGI